MRSRHEREARRAFRAIARTSRRGRLLRSGTAAVRGLEALPLFRGLPRRDLALLARRADPIELRAGAVITDERRPVPEFFVLTAGVAEQTLRGRRIGALAPGDHVGLLTLLHGEPQVPTVTTLTDVAGFVLGRREFWGVLDRSPALSMRLTASLAEKLARAQEQLAAASTAMTSRTVALDPVSSDVGRLPG